MYKEWFIIIEGKQEGPYTVPELKALPKVTPDTLVWKAGFAGWVPMRKVAELKEVFEDEKESEPIVERFKPKKILSPNTERVDDTLSLSQDPFHFLLWIFIVILIISYVIFQIYWQ